MVENPYRLLSIPFRQDHLGEKHPDAMARPLFVDEVPPKDVFGLRESTGPKQHDGIVELNQPAWITPIRIRPIRIDEVDLRQMVPDYALCRF